MDLLTSSLLDLLHELEGLSIPLTVGGGFGLYLKRRHLDATGQRTLLDRLPEPRSTNDLDLFLRTEVLVDLARTRQVAEAIGRLGYSAVETAKYLQWYREVNVGGVSQKVKLDILVGPLGEVRSQLYVKKWPRVRPREPVHFHARATEEAVHLECDALPVTVTGNRSGGEPASGQVLIPHAFPYLLMKLHAFDDRRRKGEPEKEQLHALDLYSIVGMMTEAEYNRAKELGQVYSGTKGVERARTIVSDCFASTMLKGVLRLREHKLFRDDFDLDVFRDVLKEVLGGADESRP